MLRLGHTQASLGATLALRICVFAHTILFRISRLTCLCVINLRLGYRGASTPASLALGVCVFESCIHSRIPSCRGVADIRNSQACLPSRVILKEHNSTRPLKWRVSFRFEGAASCYFSPAARLYWILPLSASG